MLEARSQGLTLSIEDGLRGVVALGLIEAEGATSADLPPEFEAERTRAIDRLKIGRAHV